MHKFSPEFERNWFGWILISKDTTANAIAGFEQDYSAACDAEFTRGSQTGRPGTDDQNIRFCFCHLERRSAISIFPQPYQFSLRRAFFLPERVGKAEVALPAS